MEKEGRRWEMGSDANGSDTILTQERLAPAWARACFPLIVAFILQPTPLQANDPALNSDKISFFDTPHRHMDSGV